MMDETLIQVMPLLCIIFLISKYLQIAQDVARPDSQGVMAALTTFLHQPALEVSGSDARSLGVQD